MSKSTNIFVLMNFPTGSPPYVVRILKVNPYIQKIFDETSNNYLSKRNIERLGEGMFPAGPRYKLFPYTLPEYFYEDWERSGPDLFDIAHERYMEKHKNISEKKDEELK